MTSSRERWACAALLAVGCTGDIAARFGPEPNPADGAGRGGVAAGGGGGDRTPSMDHPRAPLPLAPLAMARLTRAEYEHAVRDVFDAAAIADAGALLDRDHVSAGSLALGSRAVAVSRDGVRAFRDAAEAIAARAVASPAFRARFAACVTAILDPACARTTIAGLGRRLYRRPLAAVELDRWTRVVIDVAAETRDAWVGVEAALAGLLLSPNFTHRIERGRPEGGRVALTDHEIAARLSFLLWDTTPDEALLSAADAGDLGKPGGLTRALERLLADRERMTEGIRAAFDDVLGLQKVVGVGKDPTRFPMDAPALRTSMREATLRMVEDALLVRGRPLLDLYDTDVAFVDERLAPLYEVPATGVGFRALTLPPSGPRAGVLTEPSLLAAHAGVALTSPTFRGKFIREHLLCSPVPAPPADVDNTLPATVSGRTRRQQLQSHMQVPSCASCHRTIDPIGFGLEGFDALGRVQTKDNGVDVDATGELDGRSFDGSRGLAAAVRAHPRSLTCLVRHLTVHAIGVAPEDDGPLEALVADDGDRMTQLLRKLVLADAFRFAQP